MKKYLYLFLPFIVLLAIVIGFYLQGISQAERQLTWLIYIYFCLLTFIFHYGIVRTTQSRPQVFIRYFMAATTFKLLMHLGVIVIYSFLHRELATRFIITFLVMYLLFTVFEVLTVLRRPKN
jgi:hypothetical protein